MSSDLVTAARGINLRLQGSVDRESFWRERTVSQEQGKQPVLLYARNVHGWLLAVAEEYTLIRRGPEFPEPSHTTARLDLLSDGANGSIPEKASGVDTVHSVPCIYSEGSHPSYTNPK